MSTPKKHHHVPQFLLRNFADQRERLRVYRMDEERSYSASVRDIGHVNFGHSLFYPGREPDHDSLEQGMSDIEGAAAKVIKRLLENRSRTLTDDDVEVLGFLIALQWARSRFLLMVNRRAVLGQGDEQNDMYRSIGLATLLQKVISPWGARVSGDDDPKYRFCYIADFLRHGGWIWKLYRSDSPKLVVGDNLVCMWGLTEGETSEMPEPWTHHGVGVGFENCARITVPLSPRLGLVIFRKESEVRNVRASDFNRATVFNSREFVAHHPDGVAGGKLNVALLRDIDWQRIIFPVIRDGALSAADQVFEDYSQRVEKSPFDPFG